MYKRSKENHIILMDKQGKKLAVWNSGNLTVNQKVSFCIK